MGRLDSKTALITGAASGMGRAIARLFAGEGANVAVADYSSAAGEETARIIKNDGGRAIFIQVDVSQPTDVKKMIEGTIDAYGRLDILCNNAGISQRHVRTAEITDEEWDRLMGTNLKAVFLASKLAIPLMIGQGSGVIINTASIGGLRGQATEAVYCAAKGGVVLLTKSMALEYAQQGIRVNCICPD